MSLVSDRIDHTGACPVIDLTEAEKDLYRGAGWRLARFEGGILMGLFNPADVEYQANTQAMAEESVDAATAWLANAVGEVWLVLCSAYQLCEPRRIAFDDPASMAHLARVIGSETHRWC